MNSFKLLANLNILKSPDVVEILNVILVHKTIDKSPLQKISNMFHLKYLPDSYITKRRKKYGVNSIANQSIPQWYELPSILTELMQHLKKDRNINLSNFFFEIT